MIDYATTHTAAFFADFIDADTPRYYAAFAIFIIRMAAAIEASRYRHDIFSISLPPLHFFFFSCR